MYTQRLQRKRERTGYDAMEDKFYLVLGRRGKSMITYIVLLFHHNTTLM